MDDESSLHWPCRTEESSNEVSSSTPSRIDSPTEPGSDVGAPEGWAVEIVNLLDVFEEELTAVGGIPWRSDHQGLTEVLKRVLSSCEASSVLTTTDSLASNEGLGGVAKDLGITLLEWPLCGIEGAASADSSIGGVVAGIAETGSVLISSLPPGGRSPMLLPPVHIGILALSAFFLS